MKKYIVLVFVLMCLTLPAKAALDNNYYNHLVHHWRVVLGNTGPMPEGSYLFNVDRRGPRLDYFDSAKWGGAEKPTDATLMSYKDVSAATRIAYDNAHGPDTVTKNERLERALRGVLKQLNRLLVLAGERTISWDEMLDPD